MADNLDDFNRTLSRIEEAIPDALADAQASLAVVGYGAAIRRVPVDTGALRAEHIVTEGESDRIRFEPDNRPGPDTVVPRGGSPLSPPNAGDVKAALGDIEPFGIVSILNQRFYASFVHNGTSRQAPQPWLQLAADEAEAASGQLDKAIQQRIDAIDR